MIHEEICTYEVCKLAKEKGFPQDECGVNIGYYAWDGLRKIHSLVNSFAWYDEEYEHDNLYLAPTQSLLQRWLREEKGLCISVEAYPTLAIIGKVCFAWVIKSGSDGHFMESNDSLQTFSTYELTLEDALKYALENLV